MNDLSRLGLAIDTAQLKQGSTEMARFAREGRTASGSAKMVETATTKMGSSIGKAAVQMTALVTSALAVNKVITVLSGFEVGMAKVGAISGATEADLTRLRDTARELGATTEFSATQAADALGFLSMAGFNAAESIAAIPSVLDLATASGMALAEAADIASNVLSGFGFEAAQAAKVTDVLAKASAISNTNVSQLGQAMTYAAPVSKALGISIEETAAAVGSLSDAGVQGGRAGNTLRAVLSKLASPTDAARAAMQDLNLSVADLDPAANSLSEILHNLADANITLAQATEIVGVEAASNLLILTSSVTKVDDYTKTLEGAAGATSDMAKTMRDQLGGDLKTLGSVVEDLILTLGDAGLTKLLRTIIQTVTQMVSVTASGIALLSDNADMLAVALGLLAAQRIPAVVTGLIGLVTWLGTAEGLFIAGAIAARGMAIAMNLIPGVALFTGVTMAITGITRGLSESKMSAENLGVALKAVKTTTDTLDSATRTYYSNMTRGNLKAMQEQAKLSVEINKAALARAQEELRAASFYSNLFGANIYETNRMVAAREAIKKISGDLAAAMARLSAAEHAASNFNIRFGETDGVVTDAAAAIRGSGEAAYEALPGYAALREEYGSLALEAERALMAQNALAVSDFQKTIPDLITDVDALAKGLLASSGMLETTGESFEIAKGAAGDYARALEMIGEMDSLEGQSKALFDIASGMAEAAGGASNLSGEARNVYDRLIEAAFGAAQVEAQIRAADGAGMGLQDTIAGIAVKFGPAISAANKLAGALAGVLGQLGGIARGLASLSPLGAGVASAIGSLGTVGEKVATGGLKMASNVLGSIGNNLKGVWNEATKTGATVESLTKTLNSKFTPAVKKAGSSGGSAAKKIADGMTKAQKEAEKLRKEIERPMVTAIDGVANAWGDFVANGFQDFKGFAENVFKIFQGLISQMVATAARNRIMISLGLGGGGTIAGSAAQAATGGGGGLGILGQVGNIGGIGSALVGGFTNSLGALFGAGGGIGSMFSTIGAQVGTAFATGTGTAIAGAIGAIAAPLLAVTAVFSFFKKKTEELDSGLRITVGEMDTLVESFKVIKTTRFWGLSKKIREHYTAASAEIADPLLRAVTDIQAGVLNTASVLGVGASAFEGFSHVLKVSTKGLTEDEAQEAVMEAFNDLGVAFTDMIPGIQKYVRSGEDSLATLNRLSSSLAHVNDAMDLLGHNMFATSLAGGDLASTLADALGGLDGVTSAVSAYWQGFYSEQERFDTTMRRISEAFGSLGLAMPQTRAEFRSMVESIDTTTKAGAEMYAALIGMSGALNELLPSVANFTAEINFLAGSISTGLGKMITDAGNAQRASEQAATLWYRTATTLREFIADMRSVSGFLVSGNQAQAFSESRFQALLASAVAGDNQAATDLPDAAKALLESTRATAKTQVEMARAEARVLSDLGLAAGVSDIEGARHDVVAGLLGQQVDLLTSVNEYFSSGGAVDPDQIDSLNLQLGDLQSAISAAEMINYAFLKERLEVSVDLIADADIPASLRTMLDNAANGITANIDYIVRADGLTPDLRWLAMTGASEHIKTIDFVTGNTLDPDTATIALDRVSDLSKTINLIAGSDVSNELRQIALAGSSELSRTVNVVLGSDVDDRAMLLALQNVGAYEVAVRASLHQSVSDDIRRIVFGEVGTYTASIEAALSADIPDWAREVLLGRQGRLIVNITGTIATDTTAAQRELLLNANTSAMRGITVAMAFADSVDDAERELLIEQSMVALRTIEAAINPVGWTPTGLLFLRELSEDGVVTRQMNGQLDLVTPTPSAERLLYLEDDSVARKMVGTAKIYAWTTNGLSLLNMEDNLVSRTMVGKARIYEWTAKGLKLLGMSDETVDRDMRGSAWIYSWSSNGMRLLNLEDDDITRNMLGAAWLKKWSASGKRLLNLDDDTVARDMRGTAKIYSWTGNGLKLLNLDDAQVSRDMVGSAFLDAFSADGQTLLRMSSDTINRTLVGDIDLGTLTGSQKALLNAVNGSSNGKMTLGGTFTFDPTSGFQTWYANATQANITSPMVNLRNALTELTGAVRAQEKRAADEAAYAEKVAALNKFASGFADAGAGQFLGSATGIRQAANIIGANPNDDLSALQSQISDFSSNDKIESLSLYSSKMRDYLLSRVGETGLKVNRDVYNKIRPGVIASEMFNGDAQAHWEMFGRSEMLRDIEKNNAKWFNPKMFNWSSIGLSVPAFAGGGTHRGGLARVGENDMELVAPSRIYNPLETRKMMSGNNAELLSEIRAMREEQRALSMRSNQLLKRQADLQRKWDTIGMPQEQS